MATEGDCDALVDVVAEGGIHEMFTRMALASMTYASSVDQRMTEGSTL